ncbi:MAG: hypothetical protein MMC23_007118 [Stictis urceolatum]|nr:hypothetical protein [Stictis urceolata]
MGILADPKSLFITRMVQLGFAIGVLVLLAYSNEHKAYWTGLEGPVALGVVTFFFTLVLSLHALWMYIKKSYSIHGKMMLIGRQVLEFIVFLMWIGTATLMLRPRGQDFNKPLIPTPPNAAWDIGIAFTFVEIVSFILTNILVFMELKNGGSGGSTSASYV